MVTARRPLIQRRSPWETKRVRLMRAMAARTLLLAVLGLVLPRVELAAAPAHRVATHGPAGRQGQPTPRGPAVSHAVAAMSGTRATPHFAVAGLRGAVKPQVSGRIGGPAPYDARRGARIDGSLLAPKR
jgi:hypothetical protein